MSQHKARGECQELRITCHAYTPNDAVVIIIIIIMNDSSSTTRVIYFPGQKTSMSVFLLLPALDEGSSVRHTQCVCHSL